MKLSFKYGNPYFAATHFFLSRLRLPEYIKLGLKYRLNQFLVHDTE